MTPTLSRRTLLGGAALLALGPVGAAARVVAGADGFAYEVTRTDEEWRAQLGEHDFDILRLGGTEVPKSSPLWQETRSGTYACKGCALDLYTSRWKAEVDKGWVFFRQSVPNSLLMAIDFPDGLQDVMGLEILSAIEVHCRRCGSHQGHILLVEGSVLHCINGASLLFTPGEV